MKLFIAWAGDHVSRELDRMAMRSDAEGLRRASRSIERGNETWKSWLEATDGQIISLDTAGGRAQMQADHLHELEGMRDRYKEVVGTTASVGIGSTVAEAEVALKAARLRGGGRALIFSPSMEEELADNREKLETLDKAEPEDLDKGEGAGRSTPSQPSIAKPKQPHGAAGDHSQEEAIYHLLDESEKNAPPSPEHTHAAKDFEAYLHEAAQKQDQEDSRQAQNALQEAQVVRKQVAQVLQALREQAPVLEQLKGQAPQVYQVVTGLTQSVIAMARLLTPQDQPAGQPVQKSEEDLRKDLAQIPVGPAKAPGKHDYSHLLAPEHRAAGYGLEVHHAPGASVQAKPQSLLGRMLGKKPAAPEPTGGAYRAVLTFKGRAVGGITATQRKRNLMVHEIAIGGHNAHEVAPGSTPDDHVHRGGGRGTAMYEALLAHAKNAGGVTNAACGPTSSMFHQTNLKLANKHQLAYQPVEDPDFAPSAPAPGEHPGEYDSRYRSFTLDLSEADHYAAAIGLKKAAPEGYTDDFSHVRAHVMASDPHSGSLRGAVKFGLSQIRPDDYWWPKEPVAVDPNDKHIDAGEPASPDDVARYAAQNRAGSSPPAVFGVKRGHRTLLLDGKHRRAAAQASNTGLTGYIGVPKVQKPEDFVEWERHPEGGYRRYNHQTGEWLKAEMPASKPSPPKKEPRPIEKAFGGLPLPHAPRRTNLHLPVGTTIESTGRFKVMTPTGDTKWKQGRVGVIMSRQPETAAADYGHPTSSREPNN